MSGSAPWGPGTISDFSELLKQGFFTVATNYETFEYDVLVIGAGGAGLRAAIEASAAGVKVGLVCKSLLGKAHTVMAEGGMAAAMGNVDDRDNWMVHFADTMRGGQYVNNWRMAELHAKEAPARVHELEAWGAVFDRTPDGKILQRNFGGHKYPRLAHVGDRTGLELIRTLQDHGIHQGITVHMEYTIVTLLKDGDRVIGAFGYDRERGRFKVFQAKAVVLATGGLGRAYKITTNSWEGTGDGVSLAYHAGAELRDMEFIQFHPTGMIWPPSVRGLLVTEAVRGEGGILKNKEGRRFMFDDIPDLYKAQTSTDPEEGWRYTQGDKNAKRPPELLTRDHVARCINREVKAGRGSPHGGVFLDIAWIKEKIPNAAEHIRRKLPSMYHQFMQLANLDITREPMEIGPTTHYLMGGIRVDGDTQAASVPGLFAAGECAGGLHGANRLGGNSLSDLIVFGKRAGEFAAKFAKEKSTGKVNNAQIEEASRYALEPFAREGSPEGPYQVQHDLQDMMQELVGIVRRGEEMAKALDGLKQLWNRASKVAVASNREYNPGWHTALDLKHLLTVSEAITRSALDRKESRGGHFREDFPKKDPEAQKYNTVVVKAADGSMKLRREPIPPLPAELHQVIEEMK
jgi:succinate dehydrogenase flavoprotein subunit